MQYRDFRYVVPFLVQFDLYASPVDFSSAIVPEKWQLHFALNPLGLAFASSGAWISGLRM